MAEGTIFIILEMIMLVIENSVGTLLSLFGMSGSLMESLSVISNVGGGLGLMIVLVVIGAVGFFVVKFVLGTMKTLAMLTLAVLGIVAFLFIGTALV